MTASAIDPSDDIEELATTEEYTVVYQKGKRRVPWAGLFACKAKMFKFTNKVPAGTG